MLMQRRAMRPGSSTQSSSGLCGGLVGRPGRKTRANALVQEQQRVTLGREGGADALRVAPIISGCWQLAGGHGRAVFDNLHQTLAAHVEAGFESFDTADIYGSSECAFVRGSAVCTVARTTLQHDTSPQRTKQKPYSASLLRPGRPPTPPPSCSSSPSSCPTSCASREA